MSRLPRPLKKRIATCQALALLLVFLLLPAFALADQRRAEIWFAPLDQRWSRPGDGLARGASDYMALFESEAGDRLGELISVFKVYPYFASRASDDDLRKLFAWARKHGIKMALEGRLVSPEPSCGEHVDGLIADGLVRVAQRIKDVGGWLDYLAMDEPLWRTMGLRNPCRFTVQSLAQNVARNVARMRAVFPGLTIGDIEPVAQTADANGRAQEILRWITAYQRAAGEELAFFHADVVWHLPWLPNLMALNREIKARGISFGIIYNGHDQDLSDEAWLSHAEEHYHAWESEGRSPPDHAIFQSWAAYPRKLLPVTGESTFGSLIVRYGRERVAVTAQPTNGSLAGTVRGAAGKPVQRGRVRLEELRSLRDLAAMDVRGTVPNAAVQAAFAIRINTQCLCRGSAAVSFGGGRFLQMAGHRDVVLDIDDSLRGWQLAGNSRPVFAQTRDGRSALVLDISEAQTAVLNSRRFAVTPDAPFHAVFHLSARPESQYSGFSGLLFFGQDGREIFRTRQPLAPAWRLVAEASTDEEGRFQFRTPGGQTVRVTYAGSATHRPGFKVLELPEKR